MSLFENETCKKPCVCQSILRINKIQDRAKKEKCEDQRILCQVPSNDTVPIILFKSDNHPFQAFGNVGDVLYDKYGCFSTLFYRIEKVDPHTCCATLSLLRPLDEYGCLTDLICTTFRLDKTDIYIDVDLHCFCALQCINPSLVNRPLPIEPKC